MIRVGLGLEVAWLGSVNYYRNLLNAICALPERRIEPVLLAGTRVDGDVLAQLPTVEVIRSGWFDQLTPRWAIRRFSQAAFGRDPMLERFLRSHDIDVLSHSDPLGAQAGIPSICWIGDFQHLHLPQMFRLSERLYRNHDFRQQARHATRIILSSHDALRDLAAFAPSSVSKARVLQFVAQPGVTDGVADSASLQERYRVAAPYFHVPNQFWAHKNHGLILDALAVLRQRGESALVISTGATEDYRQPAYFTDLMARAEALGVADAFRPLGVVPRADLIGLMLNSVALINPSRAEGWSTSVEEAKSLGKRIILSDLSVHREQAPPDGIYVDLDDATGLADAMRATLESHDPSAERERSARATRDLPGRVRAFGEAYQAIVLEAVGAPGS